jgi:hypothetical protein
MPFLKKSDRSYVGVGLTLLLESTQIWISHYCNHKAYGSWIATALHVWLPKR